MKKCDCYREGIKAEPRYSQHTGTYVGAVDVKYEYCVGTKEIDECSCNGDRAKCDFYPEVREEAIKEEKILENINPYFDEDGTIWFKTIDGISIRITNEDLYFIDKYGNETHIKGNNISFKRNTPSYEELYDHWLKTKQND